MRRALRDHGGSTRAEARARLEACERRLSDAARRATRSQAADTLRGIEGEAARAYYEVFGDLVRNEGPAFTFTRRSRRTPLDPVNALLSFFYPAFPRWRASERWLIEPITLVS